MSPPAIRLERKPRDATWGLRIGIVLAALALAVALLLVLRGGEQGASSGLGEPALTEAALTAYLDVALDVRLGRQEARRAGWEPLRWAEYPRIVSALERVGWSMSDYMRVEGQVKAASVAITSPELSVDPDDPNSRPVPERHVEIVRARLAEVSAAQAPLPEP